MRLTAALFLTLLVACSSQSEPPRVAQKPHTCEPRLALEPLLRDASCLDVVEECMGEARTAHLRDPLDAYTPEQEELTAQRACLAKLRECRSGAWR